VVWYGVVWCGVVWCGVVWCGVVWCGVVWCGVVWWMQRDTHILSLRDAVKVNLPRFEDAVGVPPLCVVEGVTVVTVGTWSLCWQMVLPTSSCTRTCSRSTSRSRPRAAEQSPSGVLLCVIDTSLWSY
jgi:hypothetical protein